jgi:hypothetical protein
MNQPQQMQSANMHRWYEQQVSLCISAASHIRMRFTSGVWVFSPILFAAGSLNEEAYSATANINASELSVSVSLNRNRSSFGASFRQYNRITVTPVAVIIKRSFDFSEKVARNPRITYCRHGRMDSPINNSKPANKRPIRNLVIPTTLGIAPILDVHWLAVNCNLSNDKPVLRREFYVG